MRCTNLRLLNLSFITLSSLVLFSCGEDTDKNVDLTPGNNESEIVFGMQINKLSENLAEYKKIIQIKVKIEKKHLESDEKLFKKELRKSYSEMLGLKHVLLRQSNEIGFNFNKFRATQAELKRLNKRGKIGNDDFTDWSFEVVLENIIRYYRIDKKRFYSGIKNNRNDMFFAFFEPISSDSLLDVRLTNAKQTDEKHTEDRLTNHDKGGLVFETKNRAPFGIFMNRTFTENDVMYFAYNSVGLDGNCSGNSNRKVLCDLPYLALSMESNYEPDDGRRMMELNFDYISEDNQFSKRYLSFEVDNDTYFTRWALAANDIRFEEDMNSQNFVFQPKGKSRFFFKNKTGETDVVQMGGAEGYNELSAIEIGPSAVTGAEVEISNKQHLKESETALSVYTHELGKRKIHIGKPDSCGTGFRCLKIKN